jgi:hypothetical protein
LVEKHSSQGAKGRSRPRASRGCEDMSAAKFKSDRCCSNTHYLKLPPESPWEQGCNNIAPSPWVRT